MEKPLTWQGKRKDFSGINLGQIFFNITTGLLNPNDPPTDRSAVGIARVIKVGEKTVKFCATASKEYCPLCVNQFSKEEGCESPMLPKE